ncbi:MAG: hypothetical protein F7C35_08185 [Desulfurococcales archaeon]|nr:hypothetical protein [Desulfurococcales archaeon]
MEVPVRELRKDVIYTLASEAWKRARDGFWLWALSYLTLIPIDISSRFGGKLRGAPVLEAIGIIIFIVGLLWIYGASEEAVKFTPYPGSTLNKLAKTLGTALLLAGLALLMGPFMGVLSLLLILFAVILALAGLVYLIRLSGELGDTIRWRWLRPLVILLFLTSIILKIIPDPLALLVSDLAGVLTYALLAWASGEYAHYLEMRAKQVLVGPGTHTGAGI